MLAQNSGLKGALLSITAIATNAKIAKAVENAGAGYLLAVKASQPSLRARRRTPPAVAVSLTTARATIASKSRPLAS